MQFRMSIIPRPISARVSWLLVSLFGLAIVTAGAILWGAREWRQQRLLPPPAAFMEGSNPFLNTRPGVKYVGTARCTECHAKEGSTDCSLNLEDELLTDRRGYAGSCSWLVDRRRSKIHGAGVKTHPGTPLARGRLHGTPRLLSESPCP
jgi:hypothetical protein